MLGKPMNACLATQLGSRTSSGFQNPPDSVPPFPLRGKRASSSRDSSAVQRLLASFGRQLRAVFHCRRREANRCEPAVHSFWHPNRGLWRPTQVSRQPSLVFRDLPPSTSSTERPFHALDRSRPCSVLPLTCRRVAE